MQNPLTNIPPRRLAQFGLALAALTLVIVLITSSGRAITPFAIGLIIAYLLSPSVNRLSSFMPRWVAVVLMYLMVYAVLVGGTFGVVTAVSRTGDGATALSGFRGLGRDKPVLALGMTVLLLAQAGVPLTSGFVAKFGVIGDAVRTHSYAIAIIAMVSAVIAAFLYLRIMISMWIAEPEAGDDAREAVRVPALLAVAITLSVGFTLVVGFFPDWLIHAAP